MSDAARRIAALSPEQRALLLKRLQQKAPQGPVPEAPEAPRIPEGPVDRHAPVGLTDVQEVHRLGRSGLFDLSGCGSTVYTEIEIPGGAWAFAGSLSLAFRKIVERHEALRMAVLPDGRQRLLEQVPPFDVEVEDLSRKRPQEIERQIERVREEMIYGRFPIDRWPLFSVVVHQLADGMIRVHSRFDGLLMDGASRRVLIGELAHLLQNPDNPVPPAAVSFFDHARANAAFEETATYRRAREYWLERLPALSPAPRLPIARDFGPDTVPRVVLRPPWTLGREAWAELKQRASHAGITPTGLLLAAFTEALRPWSSRPDFTLGLIGSHRPPIHPQIRRVIGTFNMLYLLAAEETPGPFLARAKALQQRLSLDLDNRHFSGHKVLREWNRRSCAGARATMPILFDSVVEYSHASYVIAEQEAEHSIPQSDLHLRVVNAMASLPQVLLTCLVMEDGGDLLVISQAVEELFPEGMIPDLFGSYVDLIGRLAADGSSWSEARPVRVPAPAPLAAAPGPASATIHGLFEKRAAEIPDSPALAASGTVLTYAELERRSRELAGALGARPGPLVALATRGGWEQVVGALAILRAGAAYLPVSPDDSPERQRRRLEQGGVLLALTGPGFEDTAGWPAGVTRIAIRTERAGGGAPGPLPSSPGGLACVLFPAEGEDETGVRVEHEAAAAALLDLNRRFGLGPGDRLLAPAPLSSDLSLYGIFGALAAGATAVLPDPLATPGSLAALATREEVTVWSSPPALLEEVVAILERGPGKAALRSLRLALLHRDPIPPGLPARLGALGPGARAVAAWGSAEIPVAAAVGPAEAGGLLLLEPVAGRRLQVLDSALSPRPAWVPGQLHVSGPGTGDPLRPTGERARALPDGRIEILRPEEPPPIEALGYGADLDRIEALLGRHPGLRAAVLAWRPAETGARGRLVAWIVPHTAAPADAELRRHLRAELPEHLVPDVFLRLGSLPLRPDGRIDRGALPPPPEPEHRPEAGWDPLETELAGLWEGVLGRRPEAADDDFFALGGDSRLAVQLLARASERWGAALPVAEFFARPTLDGMAEALRRGAAPARRSLRQRLAERLFGKTPSSPAHRRSEPAGPSTPKENSDMARRSAAFGMRIFTLIWLGQFVSMIGTALGSFSLGLWLYQTTGSVTQYALMAATGGITALFMSPIAGVLADRWDRRRILILTEIGPLLTTLAMAFLLYTGRMQPGFVYPLIFLMVTFVSFQVPALTASISMLVPREQLARASGMIQSAAATSAIIGPLGAGILVSRIGAAGVILIDSFTFLFAAAMLLLVRIPTPPRRTDTARRSFFRDAFYGWGYLRERAGLFAMLKLYALTNFCMGIVQVMLAPLILSFATPAQLGSVSSAGAAGALLGGIALSVWGGPRLKIWGIFTCLVAQACLLFLGGLGPSVPLIALAAFAFMATGPFVNGCNQAIWQSKVDLDVQGRVFAIGRMIASSTPPVAALLAGPLADRVFNPLMMPGGALASTFVGQWLGVGPGRGIGLLFIVLGALVLLIVSVSFLNPRLRRVESEVPDAVPAFPSSGTPEGETRLQSA